MENKSKPCALSSFMKLLRAKSSLSNVNEIVIVEDNARRRRSSISRLRHSLTSEKCPHTRNFRKSQRWESQQAAPSSSAAPSLSSSSVANKQHDPEGPVRRRCSGILCPQRRASIERRESIESNTSVSSSASFLSFSERSSEQEQQQQLPAYELALQLISQKYATPSDAAVSGPNNISTSDGCIESMGLTPPRRRPSHGDICGRTGVHRRAQSRRSSGVKL